MTITIIRHGQTAWNAQRRMQGHTDIALCDIGRLQAEKVAARLATAACDVIYTSDLVRAAKTAEVIAARHSAEIVTTPILREFSYGIFEGRIWDEVQAEMDVYRNNGETFPGAEEREVVRTRLCAFVDEIASRNHKHVFIVSHGGTIAAMICHLLGVSYEHRTNFRVGNTALYRFKREGGEFVMTLENDMYHLQV